MVLVLSVISVPACKAADNDIASVYPDSGPSGTTVQFTVDLKSYTNGWQDYVGKRYVLLWDLEAGDEYRPEYWYTVIGSGYVGYDGVLSAPGTIPDAVAGYHTISAVYEDQSRNYLGWWQKEFIVTEGGYGYATYYPTYYPTDEPTYYPTYDPGYRATPEPEPGFGLPALLAAAGIAVLLIRGRRQ